MAPPEKKQKKKPNSGEMKKTPSKEIVASPPPCFYFNRGSRVEVWFTEQGAWFPAHVLDSNSNPLRNRKRRLLVEYETLVSDDDSSKPLTEEIEASLLRPAPPEESDEGFEEHDVVDAFHVEGWWRGVVMSVDGDKYTVGFKSPPDLLELGRGELRRHWDWCGGAWTRVEKEMMMQLDFSPWDDVEVNLHKERLWCAWTPATYVGPLGGNSFLVRYARANNGEERAVVSRHQIRPCPPQQEEGICDLMSMVDAYHDRSWWVGDITAVLTGEKYVVKFRYSKQEIEFSRSDLRHHMEWNGSKWLTTEALEESMVNEEQLRYAKSSYRNSEGKTPCYTKSRMKQSTVFVDKTPRGNTIKKLKLSQLPDNGATFSSPTLSKKLKLELSEDSLSLAALFGRATPVNISKSKGHGEKSEQQLVWHMDGEATSPVKKGGRQRKAPVNSQSPGVKQNGRKARRPKLHGKVYKVLIQRLIDVMRNALSLYRKVKMKAANFFTVCDVCSLLMQDNQQHTKGGVSSRMKVKRKLPMIVAEHSKYPTTGSEDSVRHGLAAASVVKVQLALSGMPEKEPDHDQSSSLFIKEGDSVNTMERSISGRVTETGVEGDTDQEECPNLPFVKSVPLWESIESMEVFKRFPQKPHFRPLLKTKEVLREGSAFGKMLAFASLVDQTTKLHVSDPIDVIDSHLEATVELEMHGFDVNAIKHRLTKLLELKARLEELHNQSKAIETKIAEWSQNTVKDTDTISKIDKEIEDLEENIKVLKEKRAMVVSMCSAKDSEANKWQSEAGVISEGIKNIHRSFELLAAGPL
uniref:uncharacterized protein LOC101295872 n=1 Tax=Fragaria vesca subsp. vesca TaxID=101020 RepID=UPI0005C87305|nr:PREDICTED: uncharacterized protein LOC101295872 [Fragaria vesca subsp. vesca]